jgi:hypothetical protein
MSEKEVTKEEFDELKEAFTDVLDMLGAICGSAHTLEGWGLPEERYTEIWKLGQKYSR